MLKYESVIMEWQNIFEKVMIVVYAMYSHRKKKYDILIGTDLWLDEYIIIDYDVIEFIPYRAPSQYKDRLIYVWRFPC